MVEQAIVGFLARSHSELSKAAQRLSFSELRVTPLSLDRPSNCLSSNVVFSHARACTVPVFLPLPTFQIQRSRRKSGISSRFCFLTWSGFAPTLISRCA